MRIPRPRPHIAFYRKQLGMDLGSSKWAHPWLHAHGAAEASGARPLATYYDYEYIGTCMKYISTSEVGTRMQSGYVWAPIKRGCAVLVCPHPPSFLLPPPGSGHRAFLWSRLMPCLIRHPHAPFLRPSPSTWVFVYNIHAPTGQAPLSGQASRDLGRRCIHGWVFGSAAPWMGDGASFRQPPASGRQA